MRAAAPLLDLPDDAPRDVVAGQELRRPARALVALRVSPPFFRVVRGLAAIVLRDVVEHEAAALPVAQHAAFAAHALRDEDALHARRPDHPGRVELDELHVDELGAGLIREGVPVAGALPAVAGDAVGAADSTGRQDDGLGLEDAEASAFALVAAGADDARAVGQQRRRP